MSSYLVTVKNIKLGNIKVKIRLSSHQLCIETGRHRGIERTERKCVLCDLYDIEDEYHFVCMFVYVPYITTLGGSIYKSIFM